MVQGPGSRGISCLARLRFRAQAILRLQRNCIRVGVQHASKQLSLKPVQYCTRDPAFPGPKTLNH